MFNEATKWSHQTLGTQILLPSLSSLSRLRKLSFTQLLTLKTQRSSSNSFLYIPQAGNQQADAIGSIFKVISRINSLLTTSTSTNLVQATHPSLTWMTAISLLTSLSTSALTSLKYFTLGKKNLHSNPIKNLNQSVSLSAQNPSCIPILYNPNPYEGL